LKLADFIAENKELILQEWDTFARTLRPCASMTSKALRNHAFEMLTSIAIDLGTTQSREQQITRSQGRGPRTAQTEAGEEHGVARQESSFTIEELVSEYRALRSTTLRLWSDINTSPSSQDLSDVGRFNESIDHLLTASVFTFARAMREAEEAEKRRKDQFLAMLAHELRNPLSPISAAATLLKMAKSNDPIVNNASNIIARQVAHMAALVEDLLDVSRVTRGKIELKLEPLDLSQVINDAIEQVNPQILARHHVFVAPKFLGPIIVQGDRKRLIQVIANLLSNAIKYTPERGHIELKLDLYNDQIAITIEDNGVGMAPELVPRIFDIFTQAEQTPDRTVGGLGLGLTLVKSLIELHGGKVTCFSAGVGKGSHFTLWLPKNVTKENIAERRNSPREKILTGEMLKIMLVEDNVDAAFMLAALLEATGHNVVIAHHGQEALDLCNTYVPNVFVLDIGLPDMDGYELARKIRMQPDLSHSVLIALTGYGLPQDREEAIAAGFDYHLVKPLDSERLFGILGTVSSAKP
jgi:signal transduction histidine kinase/CheY-like chemotaxis protein